MLKALEKLKVLLSSSALAPQKEAPPKAKEKPRQPKPKQEKPPRPQKEVSVFPPFYLADFSEEDWIYYRYLQRHLPVFADIIANKTPEDLAQEMEQALNSMAMDKPLNCYQKLLVSAYFICPVPTLKTRRITKWLIYRSAELVSRHSALDELPEKHNPPT